MKECPKEGELNLEEGFKRVTNGWVVAPQYYRRSLWSNLEEVHIILGGSLPLFEDLLQVANCHWFL